MLRKTDHFDPHTGSSRTTSTFQPRVRDYSTNSLFVDRTIDCGSEVVWIVDFVQTLPMQIEAVWLRKLTGTSVIYLTNHFTAGMTFVLALVGNSPGSASNKT